MYYTQLKIIRISTGGPPERGTEKHWKADLLAFLKLCLEITSGKTTPMELRQWQSLPPILSKMQI